MKITWKDKLKKVLATFTVLQMFVSLLVPALTFASVSNVTLVGWNFSDKNSSADYGDNAIGASLTGGGINITGYDADGPAGGLDNAAIADNWSPGDFWQVNFEGEGFESLYLSSEHRSSSKGPAKFDVSCRVNSGGWNIIHSFELSNASWQSPVQSVSLGSCEDGEIELRWTVSSDSKAPGNGDLQAVGTNRIDNIIISGQKIVVDNDGDGTPDNLDNCPAVANADQSDSDGDGVGNACDNCPQVANIDQKDSNSNLIGDACEALPEIPTYEASHSCGLGKKPVLIDSLSEYISSTDPNGGVINIPASGEYLFKASGSYNYDKNNFGKFADAGHATRDNWATLRSDIGIYGENAGVTSLLSDMGTGEMGVVDWGSYDSVHEYYFSYSASGSDSVQFLISDWYDDWYPLSNNQGSMGDNLGGLNIDVYGCVPDIVRSAGISTPDPNEIIIDGELNLGAYLIDDDYDNIQWAVRKGTCSSSTNTVMGNVDGKSDMFSWVYNSEENLHNFSATKDVSLWSKGGYCFVFNPTEDSGELDIRLTRWFMIDTDKDDDGRLDVLDNCPLTANSQQEDMDNDSIGDACDDDSDNDGFVDEIDNCPLIYNPEQENTYGSEELGDACEENEPPVITLTGEAVVFVEYGNPYEEQGAIYDDQEDGSGPALVSGDTVNNLLLGTYVVRYNYTDDYGNVADEVTRMVYVVPRSITVTANSQTKVFGSADPALTYVITSGTLVSGDVLSGLLSRTVGEAVGVYTIGQGTLGNPNYNIVFVTSNLTITPLVVLASATGGPILATVPAVQATLVEAEEQAVAGSQAESESPQETATDDEGEVKGSTDTVCPWWWIILLVSLVVLAFVGGIARGANDNKVIRKYYYIWPILTGAVAWFAHDILHGDFAATWFCNNYLLVILILVAVSEGAYYYLIGRESNR
jgi:hypothetical protein